jgi:uncharacterized protein
MPRSPGWIRALWDDYEALRRRIAGDLAHARPGARYLTGVA